VKQLLYFDRYTRILAPQLKVFDDARVKWQADGSSGGGLGGGSSGGFDGPEITIIPPGGSGGSSGSSGGLMYG
jgi:hypothetical protein